MITLHIKPLSPIVVPLSIREVAVKIRYGSIICCERFNQDWSRTQVLIATDLHAVLEEDEIIDAVDAFTGLSLGKHRVLKPPVQVSIVDGIIHFAGVELCSIDYSLIADTYGVPYLVDSITLEFNTNPASVVK